MSTIHEQLAYFQNRLPDQIEIVAFSDSSGWEQHMIFDERTEFVISLKRTLAGLDYRLNMYEALAIIGLCNPEAQEGLISSIQDDGSARVVTDKGEEIKGQFIEIKDPRDPSKNLLVFKIHNTESLNGH
ncbi:hypothetical protein GYA49_04145 [Candidatus Beckwithbacteria bacterium]|nr:hypothetical protein [Candidatus Beckwithbacteria bacterium]